MSAKNTSDDPWICFVCTGTCACCSSRCRALDAHKALGWVGATGGGLADVDRRPRVSRMDFVGNDSDDENGGEAGGAPADDADDCRTPDKQVESPPAAGAVRDSKAAAPANVNTTPSFQGDETDLEGDEDVPLAGPPGTPIPMKVLETAAVPPAGPPGTPIPVATAVEDGAAPADAAAVASATKASRGGGSTKRNPAAPAPASGDAPASLVGRRVEAYWSTHRRWYAGVVQSYISGWYTILYDDGDHEEVQLPDDTVRFV